MISKEALIKKVMVKLGWNEKSVIDQFIKKLNKKYDISHRGGNILVIGDMKEGAGYFAVV